MVRSSAKAFRVELMQGDGNATTSTTSADRSDEILKEIRSLKQWLEPRDNQFEGLLSAFKADLQEAAKLKTELDAIREVIEQTKLELATLHQSGFKSQKMARVTDELDAIVAGTESATNTILSAAEAIDEHAHNLQAACKREQDKSAAADISDRVVQIFEACNFQDLTGQRITKVFQTLGFIEERVMKMVDIWGGLESLKSLPVEGMPEASGDAALLNGPRLSQDTGHVSQDDIDALFN